MDHASTKIHILDSLPSRRAKIAYGMAERYSPQVYDGIEEFLRWSPSEGLLLLDEQTGGFDIANIARSVSANGAFLPIVMYNDKPSTVEIVRAMLAGAVDYLEWPFDVSQLDAAVAKIDDEAASHMRLRKRKNAARAAVNALTDREREILLMIVQGDSNKEIALRLAISPRTVEVHRANLLLKLNARSSSDAIRLAIYAGLDENL